MLSVEQCKKYLKRGDYSEEQIETIRTGLYQLADIFITEYFESKNKKDDNIK